MLRSQWELEIFSYSNPPVVAALETLYDADVYGHNSSTLIVGVAPPWRHPKCWSNQPVVRGKKIFLGSCRLLVGPV